LTDFLPLILVAVGVKVILSRSRRRHAPPPDGSAAVWGYPGMPGVPPVPPPPAGFGGPAPGTFGAPPAGGAAWQQPPPGPDVVRVFAMFWGADRRHRGPVAHVEAAAVMGGCDVDLRDAQPTTDPLVIQVFA